jgi:hypothetical protein
LVELSLGCAEHFFWKDAHPGPVARDQGVEKGEPKGADPMDKKDTTRKNRPPQSIELARQLELFNDTGEFATLSESELALLFFGQAKLLLARAQALRKIDGHGVVNLLRVLIAVAETAT